MKSILSIDLKILKKNKIKLEEFSLLLLLSFHKLNIINGFDYTNLIKQNFIIIDEVFDSVILSDEGVNFLNYLLYGNELVMDNDKIEEIAIELRSLFPNGKKYGTNQYWKDNLPNIKNNLIKFFKLYGEFDKETIIKATKKYINSFENDNTLMRTSKYFIFKDGNSELLTVIENLEENENLEDLWRMLV